MHAHMYTHICKISVFELHDTLLGEDFWPDLLHWGLPWQRSWRCQAAKTRQTGTADRWGTCTCICLSSQQNSCMNFDIHLHVNMVSQNVVCFSGSLWNVWILEYDKTKVLCLHVLSSMIYVFILHVYCTCTGTWKRKIIVKWNLPFLALRYHNA